jgi:hypothetical protein
MSVPDRFHISWVNDLASYTLAADVAVETAYPLTNCQTKHANAWATLDMTGETQVVITWSSAIERAATCFAMHNHDAPDGTTILLELFPNETQGGTELLDLDAEDVMHNIPFGSVIAGYDPIEGNFEDDGHFKTHFSKWFETVTYKSGRLTITNPGGFTDNKLRIDKLWLGFAYSPVSAIANSWESGGIEDGEHTRKPGGGMETIEDCVRRSLQLEFPAMTLENNERHVLRHIFDRAKMGGDLLVTLDPNDVRSMNYETTSIYRRMGAVRFTAVYYNRNRLGLALEEN